MWYFYKQKKKVEESGLAFTVSTMQRRLNRTGFFLLCHIMDDNQALNIGWEHRRLYNIGLKQGQKIVPVSKNVIMGTTRLL